MKNKITLTIGIPAYNEETNIGYLLKSVLKQKGKFEVDNIIVVCDGCSDKTVEIAKEIANKNSKIVIKDDRERKGKMFRLNEIYSKASGEILVTLDADTLIKDDYFVAKLISPLMTKFVDIASCKLIPLKPKNFLERILYVSVLIKNEIIEYYREGDNLYSCHGTCMAYSKKLYKNLILPEVVSEDAYLYIWSKKHDYKYKYVSEAEIYYKLPMNLGDHEKQSVRFYQGLDELTLHFNSDLISRLSKLPKLLTIQKTIKFFVLFPAEIFVYFGIRSFMKLKSYINPKESVRWATAISTRLLK